MQWQVCSTAYRVASHKQLQFVCSPHCTIRLLEFRSLILYYAMAGFVVVWFLLMLVRLLNSTCCTVRCACFYSFPSFAETILRQYIHPCFCWMFFSFKVVAACSASSKWVPHATSCTERTFTAGRCCRNCKIGNLVRWNFHHSWSGSRFGPLSQSTKTGKSTEALYWPSS